MVHYSKNKNELLVLTGAVYSFVAYLTAFTLEVLFIIDLAKRTSNGLVAPSSLIAAPTSSFSQTKATSSSSPSPFIVNSYSNDDETTTIHQQTAYEQAKLMLESMQSHMTISCLAIAILYFIIFVASLVLITALILRSTFFLVIWICTMSAMSLPEFGLIIYVSIYGWGVESRNGQTELLFYLLRAALNVIFVFRAHKLYKDWNYEKTFFMLKPGGSTFGGSRYFPGYDSPYFIGDSLSTTINPVFSSSTLNLNQYDHIRDFNHPPQHHFNKFSNTTTMPISYNHNNGNQQPEFEFQVHNQRPGSRPGSHYIASSAGSPYRASSAFDRKSVNQFYLAGEEPKQVAGSPTRGYQFNQQTQPRVDRNAEQARRAMMMSRPLSSGQHQNSKLSIDDNDEFADCEMDLDYRTLTNQQHYSSSDHKANMSNEQSAQNRPQAWTEQRTTDSRLAEGYEAGKGQSPASLSYSTQSLDRRQLRDFDYSLPEQVTLRPLGHEPFEYLRRPGSTSNLNSTNNLNTQPSFSSSAKLQDLHQRYS